MATRSSIDSSTETPDRIAARIERALAPRADRSRRQFMAGGYAPSGLRCLGVAVPQMRVVVRQFRRSLTGAPPGDVIDVALALTRRGTVEGRQAGYEILAHRPDAMARLTVRTVEALGRGNDNWASVDGFATSVASVTWRLGRVSDRDVLRWACARDKWWRRTALVCTVPLNVAARGGTGDARRTLLICNQFAGETDPMLAKALSWALRSLAPHDPAAVGAFLTRHLRLPSIVRREVTTKLETGRKTRKY
jgi:3-methyladenine DNA glycosylase AlkD